MLELLVVLAVMVLLAGILVPYVVSLREASNRAVCNVNLWRLGSALSAYAKENNSEYPRVVYQPDSPGYTAFTGPDASDPFAAGSAVRPNDVTASLWLLVRGGYISSDYAPVTRVFICPSTDDVPDPLTNAMGQPSSVKERSNFRGRSNLSYSYAIPFGAGPDYRLSADMLRYDFVLLADRNPGRRFPQDVTRVRYGDPAAEMAAGNSNNHRRARQNVLFADMHVELWASPFCGQDRDNIYTVNSLRAPSTTGPSSGPATAPAPAGHVRHAVPGGLVGTNVRPADLSDTYLVPTESD